MVVGYGRGKPENLALTEIGLLLGVHLEVNVGGKVKNKYFELKNSCGTDGVPQTRTTC